MNSTHTITRNNICTLVASNRRSVPAGYALYGFEVLGTPALVLPIDQRPPTDSGLNLFVRAILILVIQYNFLERVHCLVCKLRISPGFSTKGLNVYDIHEYFFLLLKLFHRVDMLPC
ncbi:hypothetical protein Mapa_010180 [Marchantia paleacea]|nr:hypothetical protein Mapa_010180 [Marchantia paleacea]